MDKDKKFQNPTIHSIRRLCRKKHPYSILLSQIFTIEKLQRKSPIK